MNSSTSYSTLEGDPDGSLESLGDPLRQPANAIEAIDIFVNKNPRLLKFIYDKFAEKIKFFLLYYLQSS